MKCFIACLVGLYLLSPVGLRVSRADMITAPDIPERKTPHKTASVSILPVHAMAAGGVAVALTGSLVALRVIRKRHDKQPS
jgi:hypothetical protein